MGTIDLPGKQQCNGDYFGAHLNNRFRMKNSQQYNIYGVVARYTHYLKVVAIIKIVLGLAQSSGLTTSLWRIAGLIRNKYL